MSSTDPVILGAARTPMGRLAGALGPLPAVDLGGRAIAAALARAGVPAQRVDRVILGQVLQAGQGQGPARQAAVAAGVPMDVPAVTVNSVCLSGVQALAQADRLIRLGEADVVVAGGMESMTGAPHLIPGSRAGYRLGDGRLVDALIHDGLWCAIDDQHMGTTSDAVNARLGITRAAQDAWAARSHARAAAAWDEGRLAEEVVPVEAPARRGQTITVDRDEGVRPDTTVEGLAALPPAFTAQGTITAGNASQISDGAAALVVASPRAAADLARAAQGRLVAFGSVAGPDATLHDQPAAALHAAAARAGLAADRLDRYEINEAFAAVALHATERLGVSHERVNVNGGAVALGHPIGCSGARLVVTLLAELARLGGGRGAASLCGGGGQGDAVLCEVPAA